MLGDIKNDNVIIIMIIIIIIAVSLTPNGTIRVIITTIIIIRSQVSERLWIIIIIIIVVIIIVVRCRTNLHICTHTEQQHCKIFQGSKKHRGGGNARTPCNLASLFRARALHAREQTVTKYKVRVWYIAQMDAKVRAICVCTQEVDKKCHNVKKHKQTKIKNAAREYVSKTTKNRKHIERHTHTHTNTQKKSTTSRREK